MTAARRSRRWRRTATSGFELCVPLADLGLNPCDGPATIHVWANLTGSDGWRANQCLPSLREAGEDSVWQPENNVTDWYVDTMPPDPSIYYRAVAITHVTTPGIVNDCNENDVEDVCDILDETSLDENFNGIPDECEAAPCPWDMDGNGVVDPFDSNFVTGRFGCPVGTGDPDCDKADIDGNNVVDPFDSNAVLAHFGPCP